ncbi:MAG: beta-hexosaminidase, partial [Bacteroides sp.]
IDLQKQEEIHNFTLGCITNYGMSIHKPALICVAVSDDNQNFSDVAQLSYNAEEIFQNGTYVDNCSLNLKGVKARYIRVIAKGPGLNPSGHTRPGVESRVLFDEVIIK